MCIRDSAKPAANDNRPANIRGGAIDLPKGEYRLEVVATDASGDADAMVATVTLRDEAGRDYRHSQRFADDREAFFAVSRQLSEFGDDYGIGQIVAVTVSDTVTYSGVAA